MSLLPRIALLACFAIASGPLYAIAAFCCLLLFYGEFARFDDLAAGFISIAVIGAFCGLLSIAYVVPLLAKTDLRRSVPRVFLPTLAIAAISGILVFFAPFITFVAHVFFCAYERRNSRANTTGLCPACHYPLVGLPSPICPECGTDSSLPRPG